MVRCYEMRMKKSHTKVARELRKMYSFCTMAFLACIWIVCAYAKKELKRKFRVLSRLESLFAVHSLDVENAIGIVVQTPERSRFCVYIPVPALAGICNMTCCFWHGDTPLTLTVLSWTLDNLPVETFLWGGITVEVISKCGIMVGRLGTDCLTCLNGIYKSRLKRK